MRKEFLTSLRKKLDEFEMREEEKEDILSDYEQMIQDGLSKGKSEEEVLEMLGAPERIVESLSHEYKRKKRMPASEKVVALTPIVCTIAYIIMGVAANLWHPGWLVFLLVPVMAIVADTMNDGEKHIMTAISPFLAFIVFFLLGFSQGLWHPGWLVFFIIPVFAIVNSRRSMKCLAFLTAMSPFVTLAAFFLIGHQTGVYHPTWMVLLLVVLLSILHEKKALERYVLAATLIVSSGLYLTVGYVYDDWLLASASFLIFAVGLLMTGNRIINFDFLDTPFEKAVGVLSLLLFALVGYVFDLFAVSWLFLLMTPVVSILRKEKSKKFTAISPFLALTAFVIMGYFGGYWHPGWLVFLIVPIVAIVEDA